MNAPGRRRGIDWPRTVQAACRLIERDAPGLERLAAELTVGRAELQRQFTKRLGVSPKAYARTLALQRLARDGNRERTALDAVFGAGFESSSSAYTAAASSLGLTPGRLRKAVRLGWWMGLSDLGWMLLAASSRGICWLAFGNAPGALLQDLRVAFPRAELFNDEARLYGWFEQVRDFVLLPHESLDLPVDIQGTAFQSRVWRALRQIPLGETRSYSDVARRIGRPSAVRAVANACANNRVALLIPCHRVIAADGRRSGYRWGAKRKEQLLRREGERAVR
ncbi:MAG: methylated-DNA--[protein]-cysteine S-methyltransferase [Steroidobacteraceae bacterium]